jgi:hypothetical protein
MHRAPSSADMRKAVQKLSRDFANTPGVLEINLAFHRGQPAVIVTGLADIRPAGFPGGIRMRNSDQSLYVLPIVWQKFSGLTGRTPVPKANDIDLNLDMWAGAPAVDPKPVRLIEPNKWDTFPTEQRTPPAHGDRAQASIPMRKPQFVEPNFWAKPFFKCGETCLEFYETWYTVLVYQVPSDYLLIVDGISYEFRENLSTFDQFQIRVRRNTENLSQWYDMMALPNPDPALSYTFGGHIQPIPFYGRFDHDQRLLIDVKVLGPFPFTKTSADSLGGCMHICAKGWLGSLYDNRDGGARPVDMGTINSIALDDG